MRSYDVAVVGMGPAGMAAAAESARMGLRVAVFDENPLPGGQVYRQLPGAFKTAGAPLRGAKHRHARLLIEHFNRLAGTVQIFYDTLIWGIFGDRRLTFRQNRKDGALSFDTLILCEGACERTVPFPGWTLPGVMTLGGLQRFIANQRVLPAGRVVLSGSGPLLPAVAAGCIQAGAESLTLCEASSLKGAFRLVLRLFSRADLLFEALSYLMPLIAKGVSPLRSRTVIAARGESRVEEVDVARLDSNWKPIPGTEKTLRADLVGIGFGFLPLARLCRLAGCDLSFDPGHGAFKPVIDAFMRTSRENIYAAGDAAGIGGARMAALKGRIAALHAAFASGRLGAGHLDRSISRLAWERKRLEGYVDCLDTLFTPRCGILDIIKNDTVVCRCEEATAGDILGAIEKKQTSLNAIKKRTRLGMGPCQGKVCEATAARLALRAGVAQAGLGSLTVRPPVSPIPMASMAWHADAS